ncbi:unnamed protein product [Orchesella dallaii]|uniref:Uncharacterized protein n=1 Tax=Orchesella dallaii TaxID=48710 RepID=A0ABP1Q166_9HEXA
MAIFFNHLTQFFHNFQVAYMPDFDRNKCCENYYSDIAVVSLGFSITAVTYLIGIHSWIFPHWPLYYTSMFYTTSASIPLVIYILHGIYFVWIFQMAFAFMTFISATTVGASPHCVTILKELICRRDGDNEPLRFQKAIGQLRTSSNLPLLFRTTQIINLRLLDIVEMIIIPIQTVISFFIIFCMFSLIRHWTKIDRTFRIVIQCWVALCLVSVFVTLSFCAFIYTVSLRALMSMRRREGWGSPRENKYMNQFLKSCKPLSVGVGKMYVIRKVSILNFFKFIARGTARTLLTL